MARPQAGPCAFSRRAQSRQVRARPVDPPDWRLWFVAPAILALAIVVLFPTVYLFWMSVTHWVVTDPDSYFGGAENFRELCARPTSGARRG